MAYIDTLAGVKSLLNIPTANTVHDTYITALLPIITSFFESYCNRIFAEQTLTAEKFDGNGEQTLFVRSKGHIQSVTSLYIDDVLINSDNYKVYPFYIKLTDLSALTFTSGQQNVSITYKAGYATTPSDIKFAFAQMIGNSLNTRNSQGIDSRNVQRAGVSVTYNGDIPKIVSMVLAKYANVSFGGL